MEQNFKKLDDDYISHSLEMFWSDYGISIRDFKSLTLDVVLNFHDRLFQEFGNETLSKAAESLINNSSHPESFSEIAYLKASCDVLNVIYNIFNGSPKTLITIDSLLRPSVKFWQPKFLFWINFMMEYNNFLALVIDPKKKEFIYKKEQLDCYNDKWNEAIDHRNILEAQNIQYKIQKVNNEKEKNELMAMIAETVAEKINDLDKLPKELADLSKEINHLTEILNCELNENSQLKELVVDDSDDIKKQLDMLKKNLENVEKEDIQQYIQTQMNYESLYDKLSNKYNVLESDAEILEEKYEKIDEYKQSKENLMQELNLLNNKLLYLTSDITKEDNACAALEEEFNLQSVKLISYKNSLNSQLMNSQKEQEDTIKSYEIQLKKLEDNFQKLQNIADAIEKKGSDLEKHQEEWKIHENKMQAAKNDNHRSFSEKLNDILRQINE